MHLEQHLIPHVEMRQWVIAFLFRIRWIMLQHSHHQKILEIIFNEIQNTIVSKSLSPSHAQVGAISFFQNFGATLNLHPHFHIMVTEGAFTEKEHDLQFWPANISPEDIKKTEEKICIRVLQYLRKKNVLTSCEEEKILLKENKGFSLDGSVCKGHRASSLRVFLSISHPNIFPVPHSKEIQAYSDGM